MNTRKWLVSLVALFLPLVATVSAAECPLDCPGDSNGDGQRDLLDLAVLAEHWLESCPDPSQLPIYLVTQSGVNPEQAQVLAQELDIDPKNLIMNNGAPLFIDTQHFLAVPHLAITDPDIIKRLTSDTERDGETSNLSFQGFDFKAIEAIDPVSTKVAMERTISALRNANLLPANFVPEAHYSFFESFDIKGQSILPPHPIDTQVSFQLMLGEIPLIGPGAQFDVAFSPSGAATHLLLATRLFEASIPMALITPQQAKVNFRAAYPELAAAMTNVEAKLVYYSPPLSLPNVQLIIPSYDIGGIIDVGGTQAQMVRRIVPALNDTKYVPAVYLVVQTEGNIVYAQVQVIGGASPYTYSWSSAYADLSGQTGSSVQYALLSRTAITEETVHVLVTDQNGIAVADSETVPVKVGATEIPIMGPLVTGVVDFGCERAVSDLCALNQSRYVNRMDDYAFKRYNWSGLNAWEVDFKEGPTGLDASYADNVDEVMYMGHGWGGGFTFESHHDDGSITYTDVAGDWGNKDLEWMCLLSCQVLTGTSDGKSWATRWGPTFDGLHLLCGFQTSAYDWPNFGVRFADYQLGRSFGIITITLPVRAAWIQAKKEEQPSSVECVIMGVIGPDGCSNYNDYFHGKGPIGPDIRGSNIYGYWRVVVQ